jgi:3-oxoacyl-[acyl-carrier-protein] synthase II
VPAFGTPHADARRARSPFSRRRPAPNVAAEIDRDDGDPIAPAPRARAAPKASTTPAWPRALAGGPAWFSHHAHGGVERGDVAGEAGASRVRTRRRRLAAHGRARPRRDAGRWLGTHAVALAASWIRAGRADVVLAGGADLLCRFVVSGFNCLRATSETSRPFDRRRKGLVLGEGAAVLVLESEAHAERRHARVRAVVAGMGAAADAVHMTAPDREGAGAARAIRAALADAGRGPSDVAFVSAHGTGTPYNDAMEAAALTRVFGAGRVPVNSIKGAIGHALGAAGAIEAVLCVQVLESGVVPATAGLEEIDPACATLDCVQGAARRVAARTVVSTSSGFAGANAALVLVRA